MTKRNIKPAAGHPEPRAIHNSRAILERLRNEMKLEMGKIQDHLNQSSPRHQSSFAATLNHLEDVELRMQIAIGYLRP